MRVLVMGAGGVGSYYGGVLVQRGHDVVFITRGAHLAAMRTRGLEIRSRGQVHVLRPVAAYELPAEAGGEFDLVLFTVKGYDADGAIAAVRPAIGPNTTILPLLNGVDSVDQLSAAFGAERVLAGMASISCHVAEPGVVEHRSAYVRIGMAEQSGVVTQRIEAIAAALRDAGVEIAVGTDPRYLLWDKFIRNVVNATATSACQAPIGEIRRTPEGVALYHALMAEVVAVGRAAGVPFPADAVEVNTRRLLSNAPDFNSSMQVDFERRHRVELEYLTGAVVRHGRALGVPTPTYDALYAVLKVRALSFGGISNPGE